MAEHVCNCYFTFSVTMQRRVALFASVVEIIKKNHRRAISYKAIDRHVPRSLHCQNNYIMQSVTDCIGQLAFVAHSVKMQN